jgi:glycerophosphoryl diester phosphodiesterase
MIPNYLVRGLKSRGKAVGTGYAASPSCLFREVRRGIDWIFSNNAVELQQMINATIEKESK